MLFFNFKVEAMQSEGIEIAQADLGQTMVQRWTKCDLPGRTDWPYNVCKDEAIAAGHPYWLRELDRKQLSTLQTDENNAKIFKPRVLGFHPRIVNLAKARPGDYEEVPLTPPIPS